MEAEDLLRALNTAPEKRLRLLDLAREVVGEDGQVDVEKASFLSQEISQAVDEAAAYSEATRRAVWQLKRLR